MNRRVARVLVAGGSVGTAAVVTVLWSSIVAGAALVAVVVWQLTKCRHGQRLGLLPPVLNERGERVPARWYCDACGKSWPAMFEHGPAPVPRFSGYDQSKAAAAARRAAELEERTRTLALKRAGLVDARPPAKPRLKPTPRLKPVSINSRRIAG
jgi:hypothetical protein